VPGSETRAHGLQALVGCNRSETFLLCRGQRISDVGKGGKVLVDIGLSMLNRNGPLFVPPVGLTHHATIHHAEPVVPPEVNVNRQPVAVVARDFALAGKDQLALMLQFTLDVAQRTDIGRMRANNEDNLISVVPQDRHLLQAKGALFVVSDGMGGHSRGEVASKLAIQKVEESYYQNLQDDIPTALQEAIKQANAAIYQAYEAERAQGASDFDMGATCVAAVLHDQMLYAANVGDSRVYVLHEGQLRQVTRDHSMVAQLVERGEITPAEARTHEKRHQIYRCLGLSEVEVDLFTEPVREGDTLILCTDGLCGVLEDEDLRAIVEQYGPEDSVQHLIARANEEGGPDNITAIVVRVSAA